MLTSTPRTGATDPSEIDEARRSDRLFSHRFPAYGWLGLILNLLAWASSWLRIGPWNYTFFALWFGFILVVDGLNYARKGHSPLKRSKIGFTGLFVASAPFWWLFEFFNIGVRNWHYRMGQYYSPLGFILIATLDFSTVLPAVMEIAEFLTSFERLRPRLEASDIGPKLGRRLTIALISLGVICAVLPFMFPRYTFPLVWLCVFFLLDPINNLARQKSAFGHLLAHDWRFFIAIPLSALICGFFWEMWNSLALPQWIYTIPYINSSPALFPAHLFEMPLLGYTGYLPFGLELFALYQFVLLITGRRKDDLTF
ncbi:MAG: hypothetical protein ACLQUY_11005 [Ktedonobacterales bacterium]